MTSPIRETEILGEVIEPIAPAFAPEFARMVLHLRLSDTAQERIRDMLYRNNAGTLDEGEELALENYLLVGQFVELLQANDRCEYCQVPRSDWRNGE